MRTFKKKLSEVFDFLNQKSDVEIEIEEASDFFREEMQTEIKRAQNKFEEIQSEAQNSLEELDGVLEEMEDHSDYNDRKVVEDVMSNLAFRRRKMIERLELADEPRELQEQLEDFVDDFQDMSQKQDVVIEEAVLPDSFQSSLKSLENCRSRLENFLENDYKAVESQERLENLVSDYERATEEIDNLEEKKENFEIGNIAEQIEEAESELEELKNSKSWNEYQELIQEIEELKSNKQELDQELGKAVQKMERGLKKLVYEIKNGDVNLETGLEILEDIRDGKKDAIMKRESERVEYAVKEAVETMPEDLLSDTQQNKFEKAASTLENISEYKEDIESIEKEIEELRQEKQNHEALEQEKELEKRIDGLERKKDRQESEKEDTEDQIDRKHSNIQEIEKEIQEILESSFNREVKLQNTY